jgi:hypothetical protein
MMDNDTTGPVGTVTTGLPPLTIPSPTATNNNATPKYKLYFLAVPRPSISLTRRAMMTGTNLFFARVFLTGHAQLPSAIDRCLWAPCFSFVFAPHPNPLVHDTRPLEFNTGYLLDLAWQLFRSMLFEITLVAHIADGTPLESILRLYGSGPFLVNPIVRRAIRLVSMNLTYSINIMRYGQSDEFVAAALDMIRVLVALFRERILQLQHFEPPRLERITLCAFGGYALEFILGYMSPSSLIRRRLSFFLFPFLTRACVYDNVPLSSVLNIVVTLQLRNLIRETGLPSLSRILLQRLKPVLPL